MSEQRSDYPHVYRSVRSWFSRPPIPTKLELRHLSVSKETETQAQINAWEGKDELGKPLDEIAADIIREAIEDAKNHPRGFTQKYAILMYRNTEDVYHARCLFNVKGRGNSFDTDDVIQESEPANEKGLVAMSMRHMDSAMNRVTQMSHQLATFYDRELDRKRKEVEELQKGRFAAIAMLENMMDRKQEREITLRREARFEDMKDKMVDKIDKFLPLVGGRLFPALLTSNGSPELKKLGQNTAIEMTIGAFFESLDNSQIKKILAILSEDEVILFMQLSAKRNAECAYELFQNLDKTRANDILIKVLNENQRTLFMQAVKDIDSFIKAKNEEAEKQQNGVDENESS